MPNLHCETVYNFGVAEGVMVCTPHDVQISGMIARSYTRAFS